MKKILPVGLAVIVILALFLFSGCLKKKNSVPYQIELEVWGVFDDSDVFAKVNKQYLDNNPQIKRVNYKKISSSEADYEKEILDALASGKGPDIIYLKNSWLPKHKNKLAFLPESEKYLTIFKENFVDVAYDDFVEDGQIYSMPLYCDTLALYYNKNLLNQVGITNPPQTWEEVKSQTKLLTKIDKFGNINQSAIALGRSSRDPGGINRAPDLVSILMMQNGSVMNTDNGQTTFNTSSSEIESPGNKALETYVSFSKGGSGNYTWNAKMDYSVDSFRFEDTAMMINYSYLHDRLKKSDPKLKFDIVALPQVNQNQKVNYPNYCGLTVVQNDLTRGNNSGQNYTNEDRVYEAWKYINYVTRKPVQNTRFDPGEIYLEMTRKPAARRDLIEKQKDDSFLGVFAEQALTAKSWIQPDNNAIDEIFDDMIDEIVLGRATVQRALSTAESRINTLIDIRN